jgi:integrase/recombinase XerD
MKLDDCTVRYIEHKRGLGMRFETEERILRAFCRMMGGSSTTSSVAPDEVLRFLLVNGERTRFWEIKYSVLKGFYRYAIANGYAKVAPLPPTMKRRPQALVPYIYSRQELASLFAAAAGPFPPQAQIEPYVLRVLLLLLYGAGLRISEALSLTLGDIDLDQAVICIRDTKFFKTRMVPLGGDLNTVLSEYIDRRKKTCSSGKNDPCFSFKDGRPLSRGAVEKTFRHLCVRIGIQRAGGPRNQPRLHDLRHAAAVHRVIAWYRSGKDVQRMLPHLATYLGHVHIAATQRYLTLTPELLDEASARFEQYAWEINHEQRKYDRTVGSSLSAGVSRFRAEPRH